MSGRRWFQIHLSTAIILMLGSGMIAILNMQPRSVWYRGGYDIKEYGWPYDAIEITKFSGDPRAPFVEYRKMNIAKNAAASLTVLVASVMAGNYLLRRHDRMTT